MPKHIIASIFFSVVVIFSYAQDPIAQWDSLLSLKLDTARQSKSIQLMDVRNKEFTQLLKKALEINGAFEHPFDSLSKKMSTITSPDGTFRLFNWNIEDIYKEHNFYCLVMFYDKKTEKYKIIELKDNYRRIHDAENKQLDHRNWYGALYYKIIPMEKGRNESYTLLGWNGKGPTTTQKLIDVMQFDGSDRLKFGAPIFKYPDGIKKRVILEFADDAIVSLKYHEKKDDKRIIYNHVAPLNPQVEGIKDYYYPDVTFDALILQNGKWVFEGDTDVRQEQKLKNFTDPKDLEKNF